MGRPSRRGHLSKGSSCVFARLLRACAKLSRPAWNATREFGAMRMVYDSNAWCQKGNMDAALDACMKYFVPSTS